jgi:hypothetical protein
MLGMQLVDGGVGRKPRKQSINVRLVVGQHAGQVAADSGQPTRNRQELGSPVDLNTFSPGSC